MTALRVVNIVGILLTLEGPVCVRFSKDLYRVLDAFDTGANKIIHT